jgi:unsaturated chondroitin disaccharide hydrolase
MGCQAVGIERTDNQNRFRRALDFARSQVRVLVLNEPDYLPIYTSDGRWRNSGELWTDWCGGFLAGMMWLFHRATADEWWRRQAEHYSRLLEHRKTDPHVHDLGFIFLNTYRRWYDLTGDPSLMNIVAHAGVTLSGRFQAKGQYLASFLGQESLFIDIMMNVPLLYVAAAWLESAPGADLSPLDGLIPAAERGSKADELRRIATAHCHTSQKRLVRPDGSTAHEAIFDPASGEFLRESTQQGLRPDSCWSRGLAWSLYGFGTVHRLTGDRAFLDTACRCADYFLDKLPVGRVPYWDFDLPDGPERLWDSSAAAIASSGLFQLADLATEPTVSARYRESALEVLAALCGEEFLASSTPGWEGILRHGVYHIHKKLGVDESVMWGEHFFVEALVKAIELGSKT